MSKDATLPTSSSLKDGRTILKPGARPAEGVHMPSRNDVLTERLSRYREITITVTGRKSGRTISNPVWFVLDDDKVYLLPVSGSDTQWYKNALKNPLIRIDARGTK